MPIRPTAIFGALSALIIGAAPAVAETAPKQAGAITSPEASRDEAKRKLEESQRALEADKARQAEIAKDAETIAAERAALNDQLIAAARRVQESEELLSNTEGKIDALAEQAGGVRASIRDRRGTISKLLAAMQRIGRQPPPAMITRRGDAVKTVRSAMLLSTVLPEIKYQADNLSRELDGLVRLETDLKTERAALQKTNDALASERNATDRLLADRQKAFAATQTDLSEVKARADARAREVSDLNQLIGKLDDEVAKAEIDRYEAELAKRKASEAVVLAPSETKKIAFLTPGRMKPAVPFASAKGSLAMPASGRLLRRFGEAEADGAPSKGLHLETRSEARITSPCDGWVVYAGPFRSYGQLLIINAGEGYHILLAGMRRIDVSPGQFLVAGEPAAVMSPADAGQGDAKRPVLYVEFRKDGRSIDPDPWWSLSSEKVQG
jgi:septal ring factor EnvC (AmiA/AmiB activator)